MAGYLFPLEYRWTPSGTATSLGKRILRCLPALDWAGTAPELSQASHYSRPRGSHSNLDLYSDPFRGF